MFTVFDNSILRELITFYQVFENIIRKIIEKLKQILEFDKKRLEKKKRKTKTTANKKRRTKEI